MSTRYLKLLTLALPFFLLLQGCSFYARLGAVKPPDLTKAAATTEGGGSILNGQVQAALTNSRDIR